MKRQYLLIPEIVHLKESMALAEEYGAAFEYNDFARPPVYEDPAEVDRRIAIYQSQNRDRSRDTMHGAFLDVIWSSPDSVIRSRGRQLVEQSMEIASRLGVRGIVFHTGLIGGLEIESYLQPWLDQSDEYWHRLLKQYPNLHVYLENTFEKTPRMLIALYNRMKDMKNFSLCLDYGHAILTGTSIDYWVEQTAPYVGHIHLNDNDLKNDLHMVPGEGSIDFARCREHLNHALSDIPVLLELNGLQKQRRALEFMLNL